MIKLAKPLQKILGINGVAHNEPRRAKQIARIFEWVMFFIAVCLPFFWYFAATDQISQLTSDLFMWFIWIAFTFELVVVLSMVRNKRYYLKTNWLNLFIILFTFPMFWLHFPFAAILRLFRILVLFRVLSSWWNRAIDILAKNSLIYTLIAFTSVVFIGGALVSLFDSGIKNPALGIWWAVQTITTVGYGDVVPQTLYGRIFAGVIMVMGVALITILTANFSAFLLRQKEEEIEKEANICGKLDEIQDRMVKLDKQIKSINKKLD